MFDSIESAIEDIRKGKMVIVCDDEDRENEGDLVMAAEMVTGASVNFMAKEGRGLICVPLDASITDRLGLPLSQKINSTNLDCNFTTSVDAINVTTGISASERAETIKLLSSQNSLPNDFRKPGHVFPLRAVPGGVLARSGHTEASVDLAKLAGLAPAGVICEIMNDDGTMARLDDLIQFKSKFDLKLISIKSLVNYRFKTEKIITREVELDLPTEYGDFNVVAYSSLSDEKIHLSLSRPGGNLVRVHSECLTGDVFGSSKCDCASQLHRSLELISKDGGTLIYLRQEGRGIGLVNKLKAYKLQSQGYDTVEANLELGLAVDSRDYGIAAKILFDLNLINIKLLTNNPDKVRSLEELGITIKERVPLEINPGNFNRDYLKVKKLKLGHILDLV